MIKCVSVYLDHSVANESPVQEKLRKLATAFMGVAKNQASRSEEDAVSTPLPGETLAMFYSRSRKFSSTARCE